MVQSAKNTSSDAQVNTVNVNRQGTQQRPITFQHNNKVIEHNIEHESYQHQFMTTNQESNDTPMLHLQKKYRKVDAPSLGPTASFTERNGSNLYQTTPNISDQSCVTYPLGRENIPSYPTHILAGPSSTHAGNSHDRLLHQRNLMEMGFSTNMHDSYLAMQNHAFVNMLSHPHQSNTANSSVLPHLPDEEQAGSFPNLGSRNMNLFH